MNGKGGRITLLLASHVELFLQLQLSYLGNRCFETHPARSGSETLEMAHRIKPDLIVLDMSVKDITGDLLCHALKNSPETSSIPIVIISSSCEKSAIEKVMQAGCDALLFKPVRRDQLLSAIEDCLGIKIRRHIRAEVSLPGTVYLNRQQIPTTIRSLSVGGAFVELDTGISAEDDHLGLKFRLPDSPEEITVDNATVVWRGSLEKNGPEGAGIRFRNILPESTSHIFRYLTNVITMKTRQGDAHRNLVS